MNLCSRLQKLKFKTVYLSWKCKKCKKCKIEKFIIICLGIDFLFVLILSSLYSPEFDFPEKTEMIYISIALTGSINYFLYDFYSIQEEEYIILSGIISLAQIIFRLTEFFGEPFNSKSFYRIQIIISFIGICLTIVYLFCCKFFYNDNEENIIKNDEEIN